MAYNKDRNLDVMTTKDVVKHVPLHCQTSAGTLYTEGYVSAWCNSTALLAWAAKGMSA